MKIVSQVDEKHQLLGCDAGESLASVWGYWSRLPADITRLPLQFVEYLRRRGFILCSGCPMEHPEQRGTTLG